MSSCLKSFAVFRHSIDALAIAGVFAVSLLACCIYNFWSIHPKNILFADSINYLHSSSYVANYLLSLLHGHPDRALFTDPSQVNAILLDGPIITGIYGSLFALLGRVPGHQDWAPLVLGHSFFHAASAVLVAIISFRMLRSRGMALLAGLSWGLYPGAVVATGRFMTETLGVFFVLLAVACLLAANAQEKPRCTYLAFLASGIWTGVIILLRLALAPVLVLAALVAIVNSPRKRGALLALGTGIFLGLVPWALYTKVATGTAHFITGRGPMFALYGVGWDTESDAWWTIPDSPLNAVFNSADGMAGAEVAEWRAHPAQCAGLVVAKLKRLYAEPWNDFYQKCLGLGIPEQIAVQRLLLLLALWAGAALALSRFAFVPEQSKVAAQVSTIMLAVTLPYILFECPSRYGFASFPFVIVLAVAGIWLLQKGLKKEIPDLSSYAASGVVAALLFVLVVNGESFCRFGSPAETKHDISAGRSAIKTIDISGKLPECQSVLLLVDGDKGIENAQVSINEHASPAHLISTNHFDKVRYESFELMRALLPADSSVKDLRQWRALVFPREWLNPNGTNTVVITQRDGNGSVYGDRKDTQWMLSPARFAPQKLGSELSSFEMRTVDAIPTHRVRQASFLDSSGSPRVTLTDSLRIKFGFPVSLKNESTPEINSGIDNYEKHLTPADFDVLMRDIAKDNVRINRWVLRASRFTGAGIPIPALRSSTHLEVTFKGEVKAKHAGEAGLLVALTDSKGDTVALGELPTYIKVGPGWQHFEYSELVPSGTLPEAVSKLSIALYPCGRDEAQYGVGKDAVDATFRNMSVAIKCVDSLDTYGDRIVYY